MNRSMPPGTIIPELAYPDVPAAAEWLRRSFGFVERLRIGNHRVQMTFGQGSIVVTGPATHPPADFAHAIMVCVANVDDHYQQAKAAGAPILHPPTDYPYGERQYTAEDLGGHRWTFSQTIADIDPTTWGGVLLS
jgi:uncharacterized glyoxalase superfamily protein PhnB